jgi:hypothetical protein
MNYVALFVEAIQVGIASPEDVIRDLGALLKMLRAYDDGKATELKLVADIDQSLSGNTNELEILNKIKEASQKIDTKFGTVLADTPGVVQRLVLFADIAQTLNDTEFRKVAIEFVEQSSTNILELFEIAQQVYSYFGNNIIGRGWQKAVIPSLLQKSLQDPPTLLTLTAYAGGNVLPDGWSKAKTSVDIWFSYLSSKSPQTNNSSDGFFKPHSERKEYQPAAIHPLVLPTAQEVFLNDFKEGKPQDEAQQFSSWLVESVFDGANLIPGVKPECAFAAGAFILNIAREQGVAVQADGQVKPSPENSNSFWADLSARVLEKIVINSEQSNDTLATWKNQQARIRAIVDVSPVWKSSDILSNLRSQAKNRLTEGFNEFTQTVAEQDGNIHILVAQFLTESEVYAVSGLPELRPSKPFNEDREERDRYNEKLTLIAENIDNLEQSSIEVRSLWDKTQDSKRKFDYRLASPFAEFALPEIVKQPITNLALANYLRQQNSKLTLEYQPEQSINFLWQSPESQADWASLINEPKSNLLQQWVKLEAWDSLRGRFLQIEERDRIPAEHLYNKCINLDLLVTDLNELRPQLAVLAHLGIPIDDNRFTDFIGKLEPALNSDGLDPSRKVLLCAARLEFGLTAISVATTSPEKAFGELFSNLKSDSKLVNWVSTALESANIWEARAGMNMLILLARLAEATGDLHVAAAVHNIVDSSTTTKTLVADAVKRLLQGAAPPDASGLPLAFAAFDLTRYARESAQAIALEQSYKPLWLQGLPEAEAFRLIEQLTERFASSDRTALQSFTAEGGLAAKNLLLAIFQIKLDELQREQHLTVQPLRRGTTQGRHNVVFRQLENLKKTLRSVFCSEQVLLNEYWSQEKSEGQLWWQTQYWSMLSVMQGEIPKVKKQDTSPFDVGLADDLDRELVPKKIRDDLKLSNEATAQVQSWKKNPDETYEGISWLITDRKNDGDGTNLPLDSTYFLQTEEESGTNRIFTYTINPPFYLFNWSASYHSDVETSLLSLAATLEAALPIVSEQENQDIDGRFEGEFPDLSWKEATNRLKQAVEKLQEAEGNYQKILKDQNDGNRTDEIINLLKQPLFLNTADYKEQITAAIADIRQAEAELEATESESVAKNFEVFAHEFLYEAAKLEVDRQSALKEISELEQQITDKNVEVQKIQKKIQEGEVTIAVGNVEIANLTREQAKIRSDQAIKARAAILQEIELLKNLLETETDVPNTKEKAKGKIGAMGRQVELTLIKQLNEDLKKAQAKLEEAKEREAELRKKAKRRKLISGICRFVGAVVGSIYGGPAGAALGAEIGGAVAELTNSIIDNKPPEEILAALIDNGFAIAKAGGVDLEKELNSLGAKTASQVNDFLGSLDSKLQPLLDSMPKIFDEKLINDAIQVLNLEKIPELKNLIGESYADLKQDIHKLGQVGTLLQDARIGQSIQFDSAGGLLKHLENNLFEKTKENIPRIEALGKATGEDVKKLRTDENLQKDAALKLARLLVAQIGQDAIKSRQDSVNTWIRSKRNNEQFWNDPVVQKEGKALLEALFTDPQVKGQILANIESSLLDPKILRGQIQVLLDPWQIKLDQHLADITRVEDQNAPNTAVGAADASVKYLQTCITKFETDLLPFLKGTKNSERDQLLVELNNKYEENERAIADIKDTKLELDKVKITEANAQIELENMKSKLKQANERYEIAELKVSQAAIETKVAGISKLQADKHVGEKDNLLKAAQARQKGAESKVKAAKFKVESCKALAEGATKRGAEASRIRVLLSQPPLRLLDNDLARETATARFQHAEALIDAFKAYRELVRYFVAFRGSIPQELSISGENLFSGAQPNQTWGILLQTWSEKAGEKFQEQVTISAPDPMTWELTPAQIASLFTPEGFRFIVGPQVPESEDFLIFSVGTEFESYLKKGKLAKDSPWRKEFEKCGIFLSGKVEMKLDGDGPNWKIIDLREDTTSVYFYSKEGNRNDNAKWDIANEGDPPTYTVKKVQEGRWNITRRQRPLEDGRSGFSDRFCNFIEGKIAETARVVGIVLDGKVGTSDQKLAKVDYTVEVEHLGDRYSSRKNLKLYRKKKLSTNDSRVLFLQEGVNAEDAIARVKTLSDLDRDQDQFSLTGTPLSGTTVIKLKPQGEQPFFKLRIQIIWKHFSGT